MANWLRMNSHLLPPHWASYLLLTGDDVDELQMLSRSEVADRYSRCINFGDILMSIFALDKKMRLMTINEACQPMLTAL